MGLSALLARAVATAHALTVAAPGHERARMTVEAAACAAAGVLAGSAADAGNPWPQLRHANRRHLLAAAGPRARVRATVTGEVADAVAVAIELLTDDGAQRRDARSRRDTWHPRAGQRMCSRPA